MHLAQMHPIKLHRFNLHVFLSLDQVPKRFSKLPRDFYITFQRTFCLSSCRLYSRILLHPHRRELSSKFQFEFQVQFGTVCSAPPKFRDSSQVFEDALSLSVSSLFENSPAPFQQGAIEQVQVSFQVSKDLVSDFVTSCFSIPAY